MCTYTYIYNVKSCAVMGEIDKWQVVLKVALKLTRLQFGEHLVFLRLQYSFGGIFGNFLVSNLS